MRVFLFCLLTCGLTSCVYYGDIHNNSVPITEAELSTPHHYKAPRFTVPQSAWWNRFKDPQLTQLIRVALRDSPNMKIAHTRVIAAQQLTAQTAALLWPSVNLSGYLQRQRFSAQGLAPPPFNGLTFNIGDVGLNFNYDFDFWGKHQKLLQSKVNEACAAKAASAQAQLILASAVATTYFQLLNNIEQKNLANTQWRLSQQMLSITKSRTTKGIESDIPVLTLRANIQAAKLSLEQYRQAELLSRHQLAVLLGKNPLTTTIATKPLKFQSQSVTLPTYLPANLMAYRPDIIEAKARACAAADLVEVAKARFFPDINLSALFSYQSIVARNLFNPGNQNNAITGAIDLPIFDAGARRANLGVQYAEYDQAVNEYNQTLLTALREVIDQNAILKTIQSQLRAEQTALQATRQNYDLADLRYQKGITDYIQVLKNKMTLIQHQSSQKELQLRYLQAVVGLLKALGGNDLQKQG